MIEFTPGEWKWNKGNVDLYGDDDFRVLAVQEAFPQSYIEVNEADARLIAAAPTLYKALDYCRCVMKANCETWAFLVSDFDKGRISSHIKLAMLCADAAMTQADGVERKGAKL